MNGKPIGTILEDNCDCMCLPGYSGDHCEVADDCTAGPRGKPCLNGVLEGVTGHCKCDCQEGYNGDHCEKAKNCRNGEDDKPCLN
jgi:hypothetical protein